MIIPIGHESDTVRRLPWISIAIVVLCVAVHIWVIQAMKDTEKELIGKMERLTAYYLEHRYLKLPQEPGGSEKERALEDVLSEINTGQDMPDSATVVLEQAELNRMVTDIQATVARSPYHRCGFIPARPTVFGLIVYMFLHGGWLHLLGNLLFFYLCAPFIEDAWGRPLFTVFYLLMGITAALIFAARFPHDPTPLVGASGAIAGAMGAFAVRFWKTRIRFFYIFGFSIRGTFSAPAWLMLPLWFVGELFNAKLAESTQIHAGGVAYWAHVGGFVNGCIFALAMKLFRIEEKFIKPDHEAKDTYVHKGYAALEEARELLLLRKPQQAYDVLLPVAREGHLDAEMAEQLWVLGRQLDRMGEVAPLVLRLAEKEVRQEQMELAFRHYRDAVAYAPGHTISPYARLLLLRFAVEQDFRDEAGRLAEELLAEFITRPTPATLLVQFAAIALQMRVTQPQTAEEVLTLALSHPEVPSAEKERLRQALSQG